MSVSIGTKPSSSSSAALVGCSIYRQTNLAITANTVINYSTTLFDTNSAYSAGLFTVPTGQSGYYRCSATSIASITAAGIYVGVNGSAGPYICAAAITNVGGGSQTVHANAGDTIGFYCDTTTTLVGSSAPYQQVMSIEKVGT